MKISDSSEIKAGIIGMGKMGILHAGILNSLDNVSIKAISDNQVMILKAIQNILPVVGYNNYIKMLNKEDLDLVYITTPVAHHVKIAEECANRGINFFVEKPLGMSASECINLSRKLNDEGDIINMVGYCKRFVDTFSKAKEIIDSNVLGDLIHLKSSMYVSQLFTKGGGWRYKKKESGGGVLIGISSHLIDLLLWFFGDISSVRGSCKTYYSKEVDDFAHSYLVFKNGLEGYLDASWSMRNHRLLETKIEIQCENGMLVVSDDYVKVYLDETCNGFNNGWTTYRKQDLYKGVTLDLGGPEYTLEDEHMIESIRSGAQTTIDISQGIRVQNVIDAIYRSSSEEKMVNVSEVV